ncbi:hypothetical protein OK074_5490 [Actinobacteria bacterium OK074]|nr:hypothetical protein OK074_5490 [Actinobacteria bacterium OK074]
MTTAREAPVWGRIRGVYRALAVAHAPGGLRFPLGEHRSCSPRLALRWLRGRARDVADQLDPPYARVVWGWLGDADEHAWALRFVASGEPYVFRAADEGGTRYAFIAEPVGNAVEGRVP